MIDIILEICKHFEIARGSLIAI